MNVKDMRDAFFDGVYDAIEKDKNVVILTADHGAFRLTEIAKEFPQQYLNVGISEQNMISFAGGLAASGKIVYVYSINNFITMRSLEQVNIDLCGMGCHVNLIGVGAGFTYSTDGPTHQGMQDAQAMMTLPGLQVYNVTDDINSKKLATIGYNTPGPKYFRIEKGKYDRLYQEEDIFFDGVKKLKEYNKTVIISTGCMTHTALKVAEKFKDVGVIDIFRIKPINYEKLSLLLQNVQNIITLEESTYSGGLGEKIGFFLAKNNFYKRFLPIAVKDQHCFHYGDRESLHKKYFIDKKSVYNKLKDFLEQEWI
jgi:transketolase